MSEKWSGNSDRPMRVLWVAQSCSLQDEENNPGLTGRMESLMTTYCRDRVQLAVAYMADGTHESCFSQNGIVYYAVDADLGIVITENEWQTAKAELLRIINDFRPDVIQCFGAEWPYGRIAEDTDVPVVIHMMGFLNIYFLSIHMAHGYDDRNIHWRRYLRKVIMKLIRRSPETINLKESCSESERRVMSSNRYFMGRTEWDRNIVRYYSHGSQYYNVPEMIKPYIYDSAGQWHYHYKDKIRLFTLSSGDDRKGNEIILRTAGVLKDIAGVDFEWVVAGSRDFFPRFENRTGIRREDVNIELIGMIGVNQIVEELKAADFFIHPSIMDNSPHAVCEAQIIGCPVIASNVGGVPDLVEDGETGFLYPYNEPHTLAFKIADLCRQEEILSVVSEKETKTALERHDPGVIAETLIKTYEAIIEDTGYDR